MFGGLQNLGTTWPDGLPFGFVKCAHYHLIGFGFSPTDFILG
jgi:hypothetical protein